MSSPPSAGPQQPSDYNYVRTAHASLGILAWTVFFPLGSVLIRALSGPKTWFIHGLIQMFSYACFTTAVAMGIWMTMNSNNAIGSYHPVIGLVLFALASFQPIGGLVHHIFYKRGNRKEVIAQTHIWLGRILITLGMINGGLGLLLSGNASNAEYIAYGVIAAVLWLAYVVYIASWQSRARKQKVEFLKRSDSENSSDMGMDEHK